MRCGDENSLRKLSLIHGVCVLLLCSAFAVINASTLSQNYAGIISFVLAQPESGQRCRCGTICPHVSANSLPKISETPEILVWNPRQVKGDTLSSKNSFKEGDIHCLSWMFRRLMLECPHVLISERPNVQMSRCPNEEMLRCFQGMRLRQLSGYPSLRQSKLTLKTKLFPTCNTPHTEAPYLKKAFPVFFTVQRLFKVHRLQICVTIAEKDDDNPVSGVTFCAFRRS